MKDGDPRVRGAAGRDVVERQLRDEIQRGEIVPGQRLVETDLSERFGVTRGSARLALDALVADGLVERIRNRGGRVRTFSTAEAVEILECRMVLDALLSRKAAEAGTAGDIGDLVANLERMDDAVTARDLLKYSDLIQEHHAFVRQAARHQVASDVVSRLQAQIVRHQFRLSLRLPRALQSLGELREVVEAIAGRDGERAEQATRAHFLGVIAAVVAESGDA